MLSWLVLLIGVIVALAFFARQRRNPNPGAWIGALLIVGAAVWVSSLVQGDPESVVPQETTTDIPAPAAQERPSPFEPAPDTLQVEPRPATP